MYNNLLAEMNRRGLHIYDLQKIINVGRGTAYSKMAGKTDWTLQEMLKVQDFFNDGLNQFDKLTLDYLFKWVNNDRKGAELLIQKWQVKRIVNGQAMTERPKEPNESKGVKGNV